MTLQAFLDYRSPRDLRAEVPKGSRLPVLDLQVLNGDDDPLDVTGATIAFYLRDEAGVSKVAGTAGTVVNGPEGRVRYSWGATDTNTSGRFFGQFKITVGGVYYLVPDNRIQRLVVTVGDVVV